MRDAIVMAEATGSNLKLSRLALSHLNNSRLPSTTLRGLRVIDAFIEGEHYSFGAPWKRGGEANVYRFTPCENFVTKFGSGQFVVKIYRVGKTSAQQKAQEQRQTKLPNFPKGLPENVASPVALVFDADGQVIGYVMALVPNATPLIKLKVKEYRDKHGYTISRLLKIFANLRDLVRTLHAKGVVIGDLNDKNVLVGENDEVYVIDADSFQYGSWKCVALVPGFADSRIVRIKPDDPKDGLQLIADFDELSDWLAFDVMLCQIVIGTNPLIGGICASTDSQGKLLQGNRRIVANITIFHVTVQPSDVAMPLTILPDALLSRWKGVFSQRVERSPFPEELLDPNLWIDCPKCRTQHGRSQCPSCGAQGVVPVTTPPPPPAATTAFGGARVLAAAFHGSTRYLTYHDGAYRREDGTVLWRGAYDDQLKFAISGESTIFVRGSRLVEVNSSRSPREFETHALNGVATNSRHIYWVQDGSIMRSSESGSVIVAPAPSHLTSVWAGEQFGVAFVQTGIINQILTFDAEGGLTGRLSLPPELGTITDVHCVVGKRLAWVTMLVQENGAESIRCFVVEQSARLIASVEAPRSTAAPWLSAFSASTAVAFRDKLIVAVHGVGLVRVSIDIARLTTPHVEKTSSKYREMVSKEPTVGMIFTDKELLHVSTTSATTVS